MDAIRRTPMLGGCAGTLLVAVVMLAASCSGGDAAPASPGAATDSEPQRPYVFTLGGLTVEQVRGLWSVVGVKSVEPANGRIRVVWQPYEKDPSPTSILGRRWIRGAEKIYDYLVIRDPLGGTKWTHGGKINNSAGTIIEQYGIAFGMMFNDAKTGHNEGLLLYCWSEALAGQVEHEMFRAMDPTTAKIRKCGDGYVMVEGDVGYATVVWPVSDQMFVRLDNSFDPEMVAAYVNRLGSVLPKDFKFDDQKWLENEIRWRLARAYELHERRIRFSDRVSIIWGENVFIKTSFLSFPSDTNPWIRLTPGSSVEDERRYLQYLREWLWANRQNMKRRDRTFVLKGKDLYDPAHPPEVPEEFLPPWEKKDGMVPGPVERSEAGNGKAPDPKEGQPAGGLPDGSP